MLEGKYITKLPGKGSVVGVINTQSHQDLLSQQTKVCGNLIFIQPSFDGFVPDYITKISKNLETICKQNALGFTSLSSPNASQVSDVINKQDVFGAVVCKYADEKILDVLKTQNIPTCLLFCQSEGFDCICTDTDKTMEALADKLSELGHADIFFIGFMHDSDLKDSFIKTLTQKDMKVTPDSALISYNQDSERLGYDFFSRLFRTNKSGFSVLCATDKIAKGVIQGAQNFGLDVPKDLSVMSFFGCDKNVSNINFDFFEIAARVFAQITLQNTFKCSGNATTLISGSLENNATIGAVQTSIKQRSTISDFLL
jgi:DNA-binding LacI/PurR family transcriptional regulator